MPEIYLEDESRSNPSFADSKKEGLLPKSENFREPLHLTWLGLMNEGTQML